MEIFENHLSTMCDGDGEVDRAFVSYGPNKHVKDWILCAVGRSEVRGYFRHVWGFKDKPELTPDFIEVLRESLLGFHGFADELHLFITKGEPEFFTLE